MKTADKPKSIAGKRIGTTLVNEGVISQEQFEKALKTYQSEPASVRRRISTIITEDFEVDRHRVMKVVARLYAFREVLQNEEPNKELIERVEKLLDNLPEEISEDLIFRKSIPLKAEDNQLLIATADPTDPEISKIANDLPYKMYELAYCRLERINRIIGLVYEQKNEFLDILEEMDYEEPEIVEEEEIDDEKLDAEINKSMLNSLVEGMLVEAVRDGASDIHIIPGAKNVTEILFRLDGKLRVWHRQPGVKPEALCAVVKDKSLNVDRFERDATQDGFIQRKIDGTNIRYRVSIMPMVGEEFNRKLESIVIRVLDDRKVITDLNKLGLQEKAFEDFHSSITKPSGIVIITGPTGSGKSTTLVAALHTVLTPEVNVLTIEEPVEYLIKGARQLKISEKMTFDRAMRGILRHDPDIVLVGEIRDLTTAEIAIKLANTGHLTFSTLHTNDAPSAVARLYKMGVEPFLIANAINLVMAQRLLRRLCENCKQPHADMSRESARQVGFTEDEIDEITFYTPVGCEKCNGGYRGRIAIHEALYFDKKIKRMIFDSGDEIDEDAIRQQAIKNGMLTLRASGRKRIKDGITTIEEVMAITLDD